MNLQWDYFFQSINQIERSSFSTLRGNTNYGTNFRHNGCNPTCSHNMSYLNLLENLGTFTFFQDTDTNTHLVSRLFRCPQHPPEAIGCRWNAQQLVFGNIYGSVRNISDPPNTCCFLWQQKICAVYCSRYMNQTSCPRHKLEESQT